LICHGVYLFNKNKNYLLTGSLYIIIREKLEKIAMAMFVEQVIK